MASGSIKGFFRQKKGGVSKPAPSTKKRSAKAAALTAAADSTAVIPHASPDLQEYGEEAEERLRQFDLDMRYGPCLGLTRIERWDRASSMGLNPPVDVEALLLRSTGGRPGLDCLWEGRV